MAMANNSYYLEASVGKDDNFEKMFKNFTFKCLQVIIQSRMEIKNKRLLKEPSSADY
ncbi:autophagy protein 13, partial [Biomphalaria glabrata]